MFDVAVWEEKIKEKRKQTPWKDYVKDILSWYPIAFYKHGNLLAKYPAGSRIKGVVKNEDFEKTRNGLVKQGIDYDFGKTFFENYSSLFSSLELPNLSHIGENENADYAETIRNTENVYLSRNVTNACENVVYSFSVKEGSKNIFNSFMTWKNCENIFFGIGIISSFNVFYSKYIYNCSDIWFSSNLIGCHDCIFCDGLENQSYCIFCDGLENQSYCIENVPYDKEKYLQKKSEILKDNEKFQEYLTRILDKKSNNIYSDHVDGLFFINSQEVSNGYYISTMRGGRNVVLCGYSSGVENIYDTFLSGAKSDFYGAVNCGAYSECIFNSILTTNSMHIFYSSNVEGCSYCIGCIGLKNKQFCILNKEYTKEERYKKAEEIFTKIESEGILGKFFPGWMNPSYFNDTAAYLIDDTFTKEEVTKEGYLWRDEEIKVDIPAGADVVEVKDLKDYQRFNFQGEREINPDILKKVIKDEKGNYYRIVKMEYDFLMKHGLPLPELHRLERIKLGFKFK